MAATMPLVCPDCKHVQRDQDAGFCAKCRFPLMLIAGKYRLVRKLGEGGFGYVYLAEHVRLQQESERVVKIIKPEVFQLDRSMRVRFEREVQMTSILSQKCQHIVRIYDDFGEVPQLGHFYVMEYLQGQPISAFLRDPERLPPLPWCVHVFGQLCDAMRRAHEVDIVHRDLKPDNLMMTTYGDEPHFLKVLDFGIAKPTDDANLPNAQQGITQGILGTPIYMAPELFAEGVDIDYHVDIYAMGIILYEMLVGEPPFLPKSRAQTSFFRLLSSHLTEAPPSLRARRPDREIPEALEAVVMRALNKAPEERFDSALSFKQAVYDAIGHAIDGPSLSIPPMAAPSPVSSPVASGEVVVAQARQQPTPSFTPSRPPDPLNEAVGEAREEVTNVRPSIWQPQESALHPDTPLPLEPASLPPPHAQTPMYLPSPVQSQHFSSASSHQGLPSADGLTPPPGSSSTHTPFPSLHPPPASSAKPSTPSRATVHGIPMVDEHTDTLSTRKRNLLMAISGVVGGLVLATFVLIFTHNDSAPPTPRESGAAMAQGPSSGNLPALPPQTRAQATPARAIARPSDPPPLPIQPLPIRPLPRGSQGDTPGTQPPRSHQRRKRSRRASKRRQGHGICPPARQHIAWHRIKISPRHARLSIQTKGHTSIRHSSVKGYRCVWFRHHMATLVISRHGYRTCKVTIRRLTLRLNLQLKRNTQHIDRSDYCRFH